MMRPVMRPMMRLGGASRFHAGISLLALAFLGLFLLYPLWLVLRSSVQDDAGGFTWAAYAEILSSRYYLGSLGNSLAAGAMSMVLASCIGVPLAFCLARLAVPGKALLLTLASVPLVLPSFVGAYALVLLFGHLRHGRHCRRVHPDPLPLRAAADPGRVQGG